MDEILENNHKMITRNKSKKIIGNELLENCMKKSKGIKKKKFYKISSQNKKSMNDDSKNDNNNERKKINTSGIDINVEQLAQFMTKEFFNNINNKKRRIKKKEILKKKN